MQNHGYEESRREQSRLHEELAQREEALGETHITSIHEVNELKGAQEIRIDEFSRCELRESQVTIQELTSQILELQERVNFMNDSGELQDVESILLWEIIPRSQSKSLRPGTCSVHRETFLAVHAHQSIHHRHLIKECFTLRI